MSGYEHPIPMMFLAHIPKNMVMNMGKKELLDEIERLKKEKIQKENELSIKNALLDTYEKVLKETLERLKLATAKQLMTVSVNVTGLDKEAARLTLENAQKRTMEELKKLGIDGKYNVLAIPHTTTVNVFG